MKRVGYTGAPMKWRTSCRLALHSRHPTTGFLPPSAPPARKPSPSEQCRLPLVWSGKHAHDHPRVRRNEMKLLRCPDEELEVRSRENVHVLRPHLLEGLARLAVGVFEAVRGAVRELRDHLEGSTPTIVGEELELVGQLTHLPQLVSIPFAGFFLPNEVDHPAGLEDGQGELLRLGADNDRVE